MSRNEVSMNCSRATFDFLMHRSVMHGGLDRKSSTFHSGLWEMSIESVSH